MHGTASPAGIRSRSRQRDRCCRSNDFARLFGYGGAFDKFFKENLEPLVDTLAGAVGVATGAYRASRAMLEQFAGGAASIRELFFPYDAVTLDVRFAVTLTEVDTGTPRFTLEIDGQPFEYRSTGRCGLGKVAGYSEPRPRRPLTFSIPAAARIARSSRAVGLVPPDRRRAGSRQSDVRFELLTRLDRHHARIVIDPRASSIRYEPLLAAIQVRHVTARGVGVPTQGSQRVADGRRDRAGDIPGGDSWK